MSSLEESLASVERRITESCRRAGRERDEITLVAVSKTLPAPILSRAIAAGVTDLGENRVQELRDKIDQVQGAARYHLVGHLQSNKAKLAVSLFDVVQSVDSLALAEKLARAADQLRKPVDVMVQVNIGREAQKSGIDIDEAGPLTRAIRSLDSIRFLGFMTIPPVADEASTRGYFRAMRELRDQARADTDETFPGHLSFGMTDDFEIAIEEGATMIRVGRAIFGERL